VGQDSLTTNLAVTLYKPVTGATSAIDETDIEDMFFIVSYKLS
jgi:hypothetical protein